jgi:hypothetical protein
MITDMSTKALVIAVVGAASVGAAAMGGFVAMRLNSADRAMASVGAPNPPATEATPTATATTQPATAPQSTANASTPADPPAPKKTPAPIRTTPASQPQHSLPVTPAPARGVASPVDLPAPPPATTAPPPTPDPPVPQTDAAPPEPPKPQFDEITVKSDSVLGLVLETAVSSSTAKVEDRVSAHVARDLMVDGRVVVPVNSKIEGVVAAVERGGKFSTQSRIGIKFTTLYLPDNTKVTIQTDTIFRDGEAPGNEATAKIGAGAVIGAILGGVIGGKKGAAIGAGAGAAGGTAAVAAGKTNDATFAAGSPLTVRLTSPVTVTVRRDSDSGRP